MAEITAGMVKELRERTDSPMMDCKKALTEAAGDMARAEEILRVRFGNKASRAATRIAAEGTVGIYISADSKSGAMVEVNCETDFVARNDDFLAFTRNLAELVAANSPADVTAVSALKLGDATVEEARTRLIGKIGENVSIRRFVQINGQGKLASYVHGGRIGVLVDMTGGDAQLARDVAMHIAASKPKSMDETGVDPVLMEAERRVAVEKAREAGKPAAMLDKIADGSVQKFLKEVTLLNQPFVKDDKQTIGQLLKARGAGVAGFALYIVGEGLEKRQNDFAAEVAAMSRM